MMRVRPEPTKKRGSEQHAGHHLGYDLRLAESRSDRSYDPAERENNRELKKKLNCEMVVVHWIYLQSADFSGAETNRATENSQRFGHGQERTWRSKEGKEILLVFGMEARWIRHNRSGNVYDRIMAGVLSGGATTTQLLRQC
jgi:hypothetical protein